MGFLRSPIASRAPKEGINPKTRYASGILKIVANCAKKVNTAPIQDHQIVQIFLPVDFSPVREHQVFLQVVYAQQDIIPALVQKNARDAQQDILETKTVELVLSKRVFFATRVNTNRVLANKLVKHVPLVMQVPGALHL